jgi:hypothetical protein
MPFEPFRFFIYTCRDPKTDFRQPLVDALSRNFETYYIWLRRRPVVVGPSTAGVPVEMSLTAFLRFMLGFQRDELINVYFNSTNTYFPGLMALLRCVTPTGLWCFDMHDDLRYHNTGTTRWREGLIVSFLRGLSDVTVHAALTLLELFPDSRHLGNASNIGPLPDDERSDDAMLIIASFDERFDFDFVSALASACPGLKFHLYGWMRPGDLATIARVEALTRDCANVEYRGPYEMADLPAILRRYRVSVAPYLTETRITRYIDPLRFYHCLNAGLEVVSTNIPQARFMADWVHVVRDVKSCARTLAAIQAGEIAKQPDYAPITWEQRADRLVTIVRSLPRTAALRQRRFKQVVAKRMIGSG